MNNIGLIFRNYFYNNANKISFKMKLLKEILLAVIISISIDVFAENPTSDGSGFIPVKTVTLRMKSASNLPKMPSNAVILCAYSTNYLIISVPETAEIADQKGKV